MGERRRGSAKGKQERSERGRGKQEGYTMEIQFTTMTSKYRERMK